MDAAVTVIQEVGFPIAAAIGLGWFIYKLVIRIVDGMEQKLDIVDEKVAQKDIDVINKSIELKLQEFKKENPGKKPLMAPKPYKTHQEDPTIPEGKIKFNFKMKASGINSKTKEPFEQKPNLYDFKLDPIPTEKNIWSESVIRVQYEPFGYYVASTGLGCTLRLKGVQVKTLVEGQTQDIGFTKVEPGENRVATEEANY